MSARTRRSLRRHVLVYAGLAPFLVIALFPIYWMAPQTLITEADR